MRIKLDFADIECYLESPITKIWFLLDLEDIKTVADLSKEVTHRFQLKCDSDSLHLTLDDCLLPNWESTRILRDDDTVRIHVAQASCQTKHKKRKRHSVNDCEHANLDSAAKLEVHNVEKSASLVDVDQSQESVVALKKKKKKLESYCHSDGYSSDISSKQSEDKSAKRCNLATADYWLSSAQTLEASATAQNGIDSDTAYQHDLTVNDIQATHTVPDNLELLMQPHGPQPQIAPLATEVVEDCGVTAALSPANQQLNLNDSSFVSDRDQMKISHSAKRRRRRRQRCGKNTGTKHEEDVTNNEESKHVKTAEIVSSSNKCPTHTTAASHSSVSGVGRMHIIFDNVNSDDEKRLKAQDTTHHTCEQDGGETMRDDNPVSGCQSIGAVSDINSSSTVETVSQLQHEDSVFSGIVSHDVKKASAATRFPSETKAYRQAKNAPFANVQFYCRQRTKKPGSATFTLQQQATDTATSLPEKNNDVKQTTAVKDYSQYCRLQGTPRVGDLLAYKMVEITEDYTPAMSQYKEATVAEFNPSTNMVVLHTDSDSRQKRAPGRFDISIEYEDEILTNVCQNSKICVPWTALHDVRLLKTD